MESNRVKQMGSGIAAMTLLMLSPLVAATDLSDLKTSASQIDINTFANFVKQLSSDGLGNIKLTQLEKLLKAGESLSILQTDPDNGSQLSITVTPSRKYAAISYYLEGAAYEKLGVDYATGVLQLSEAITNIKQPQPLETADDAISSEEAKDDQSMVGWQWRSGNFKCRLAMSNADVMGGDLIYECHN